MECAKRVRDLIGIAGQLISLIDEETKLLAAFETDRIGGLIEDKQRLVRAYAAQVRELRREPEMMAALGNALRDELREVLARFDAAAKANERALSVARVANERVVKAIVDAASAQQVPSTGAYGRSGAIAAPSRAAAARPLSIAVNQSL